MVYLRTISIKGTLTRTYTVYTRWSWRFSVKASSIPPQEWWYCGRRYITDRCTTVRGDMICLLRGTWRCKMAFQNWRQWRGIFFIYGWNMHSFQAEDDVVQNRYLFTMLCIGCNWLWLFLSMCGSDIVNNYNLFLTLRFANINNASFDRLLCF